MKIYDAIIVGGGSAGVMAALRGVLNNDKILLFNGNGKTRKASRAAWVTKVENIPAHHHYNRGILNPNKETFEWISKSKFAENLVQLNTKVVDIVKNENIFEVIDEAGEKFQAHNVVLATGVMDVQPHINGTIQTILPYANVQLVDYCLRCDGHHVHDKKLVVIGGGDNAAWTAIMLVERYNVKKATLLTHGDNKEFSSEVSELLKLYNIAVKHDEIIGVQGNPRENYLEGFDLKNGELVYADIAFISMGMIVYNDLAKKLNANLDNRGFVVTDAKSMTNIEGLYAVGDLQANKKKQIYTGWDTAVDALDDINAKKRRRVRSEKLASFRQAH